MRIGRFAALGVAASLAACATEPLGPLVQVMPGPGKSFAQFQDENLSCRRYASMSVEGQAQAINNQAVGGAVLTTVLGTGLGAIVGGGRGAAVGAVTGAGLGVGLGAGSSSGSQGGIQYQYDNAFAQCMYARGNQVPGYLPPQPVTYSPAPVPVPARSGLVMAIQTELNRLGVAPITPDGIAGPQTVSAIQSFQAVHGIPPDGVPSPALLAALRETPTGY